MRRLALILGMVALLGAVVAPAGAASPERYQTTTVTYKVLVLNHYEHDYTVVINPCDGSLAMTGGTPIDSGYYTTETITAAIDNNGIISYHSVYDGPYNPGYDYHGAFSITSGPLTGDYPGYVTRTSDFVMSEWKNHGQYVKSMGGGDDAAHSCIGMPIVPK
jgi:hypothetical protein